MHILQYKREMITTDVLDRMWKGITGSDQYYDSLGFIGQHGIRMEGVMEEGEPGEMHNLEIYIDLYVHHIKYFYDGDTMDIWHLDEWWDLLSETQWENITEVMPLNSQGIVVKYPNGNIVSTCYDYEFRHPIESQVERGLFPIQELWIPKENIVVSDDELNTKRFNALMKKGMKKT